MSTLGSFGEVNLQDPNLYPCRCATLATTAVGVKIFKKSSPYAICQADTAGRFKVGIFKGLERSRSVGCLRWQNMHQTPFQFCEPCSKQFKLNPCPFSRVGIFPKTDTGTIPSRGGGLGAFSQ
jgi:hypothetical protein